MDISELLGGTKTEEKDKIAYSAGVVMALSLRDIGFSELNYNDFLEGVEAVFENKFSKISRPKSISIFNNYVSLLRKDIRETNKKAGEYFLNKNAKKEQVITLKSGLQYEILKEGNGKTPQYHNSVTVIYEGKLLNGQVFDSTKENGEQTFDISEMIAGWQEILVQMKEGSRYRIFVPSHLAYGDSGAPPMIQPGATLIFTIELLKVVD